MTTFRVNIADCILLALYHRQYMSVEDMTELFEGEYPHHELTVLEARGEIEQQRDYGENFTITSAGYQIAEPLYNIQTHKTSEISHQSVLLYLALENARQANQTKRAVNDLKKWLEDKAKDAKFYKESLESADERIGELMKLYEAEQQNHNKTYTERTESRQKFKDLVKEIRVMCFSLNHAYHAGSTNAEKIGIMKFVASAILSIVANAEYEEIPF